MGQVESNTVVQGEDLYGDSVLHKDLTLHGIAEAIKHGDIKKICILSGAGISVSAGIPDFRTPESGLYYNLEDYNLPSPEMLFDLQYFMNNPEKYYSFYYNTHNNHYHPTYTHAFVRLLQEKGLLLRQYTQNIDNLEKVAGIKDELLIQTHGTMESCSCISCKKEYTMNYLTDCLSHDILPRCTCGGLIKPGIVFFGEPLPLKYTWYKQNDLQTCDLLIVLGTSLSVEPMASLVHCVRDNIPRLLINRESVGPFRFCGMSSCYRDVEYLGDCDDGIRYLCSLLDWEDELEQIYTTINESSCDSEDILNEITIDSRNSSLQSLIPTYNPLTLVSTNQTYNIVKSVEESVFPQIIKITV